MPLPEPSTTGFLPVGVHNCSLDELAEFAVPKSSVHRALLIRDLRGYHTRAKKCDKAIALLIDGSFLTSDPHPSDVDFGLLLRVERNELTLDRATKELISHQIVRQIYKGLDLVFVAKDGSTTANDYVKFFTDVKHKPNEQKGMVRVNL